MPGVCSWLDVNVLLNCNRVKTLTTDLAQVKESLKSSTLLELNEAGDHFRRRVPFVAPSRYVAHCCLRVAALAAV